MRIVCDATGVEMDAAPEVAEALDGHGFTISGDLAQDLEVEVADDDGYLDDAGEDQVEDGINAEAGDLGQELNSPKPDKFDGWEPTKEFLREREIAELREFAAERGVELPKPANKGQIVNAIVAALAE